jgi:hypothetical protein
VPTACPRQPDAPCNPTALLRSDCSGNSLLILLIPGEWYRVTEMLKAHSRNRSIRAFVLWLRNSAEIPATPILRMRRGRGPYLSAKIPVGIVIVSRQRFGTVINKPAWNIDNPNSAPKTGSNAEGIKRNNSTSMWLVQTAAKGFVASFLTLNILVVCDTYSILSGDYDKTISIK